MPLGRTPLTFPSVSFFMSTGSLILESIKEAPAAQQTHKISISFSSRLASIVIGPRVPLFGDYDPGDREEKIKLNKLKGFMCKQSLLHTNKGDHHPGD